MSPQRPPAKRVSRRTVDGVVFIRTPAGWRTEDRRFEVEKDGSDYYSCGSRYLLIPKGEPKAKPSYHASLRAIAAEIKKAAAGGTA